MKKKVTFVFVVILLMVVASTLLGNYSTSSAKYRLTRIVGNIAYIDSNTMDVCVEFPGWPYTWLECARVVSRTQITSIICNEDEMIRMPTNFNELAKGMWMEAGTTVDNIAHQISICTDGKDCIPCK